jgi:hypothetical protein
MLDSEILKFIISKGVEKYYVETSNSGELWCAIRTNAEKHKKHPVIDCGRKFNKIFHAALLLLFLSLYISGPVSECVCGVVTLSRAQLRT